MKEFTIKEISHDEYLANLEADLKKQGLHKAISNRLDEILYEANGESYLHYMTIVQFVTEINDILDIYDKRRKEK